MRVSESGCFRGFRLLPGPNPGIPIIRCLLHVIAVVGPHPQDGTNVRRIGRARTLLAHDLTFFVITGSLSDIVFLGLCLLRRHHLHLILGTLGLLGMRRGEGGQHDAGNGREGGDELDIHTELLIAVIGLNKPEVDFLGADNGRCGGIRTPDVLLPKQARYRTALHTDSKGKPPTFEVIPRRLLGKLKKVSGLPFEPDRLNCGRE